MRLIIQQNPEEVTAWVASYVVKRINAFAPTPDRPFVLGRYNIMISPLPLFFRDDANHGLNNQSCAHLVRNCENITSPTGLPTGSSPLLMYKKLIELHKAGEVSFANVITFKLVASLAKFVLGSDSGSCSVVITA